MRCRRASTDKSLHPNGIRFPADQQALVMGKMADEIACSPVLAAFGIQVRCHQGHFFLECPTANVLPSWGRITPVKDDFLLEVESQVQSWDEVARGSPQKLIQVIAGDSKGTFHGLGSLDHSLRKAGQGLTRLPMQLVDKKFVYTDSGAGGTVQEALFHFFGLPIPIIAQPAIWYTNHRIPHFLEFSEDHTRVLVRFSGKKLADESFGGSCLYALRHRKWGAYPVKSSEGWSIATAEAWLVKRKWKGVGLSCKSAS